MNADSFDSLFSAAARAPSGDNTQPWRFILDRVRRRILVRVVPERDPSPMNAGQRMARIACGAAVENLLISARACGWGLRVGDDSGDALAVIEIEKEGPIAISPAGDIAARVTNRRVYEGRPVPADVLERLGRVACPRPGTRLTWVGDRARLGALAAVIGRADTVMFGEHSMRQAFLHNIRFDADFAAEVEEGMSKASLEVSRPEIQGMNTVFRGPDWLFKLSGSRMMLGMHTRRLITSASGLAVVTTADRSPGVDFEVGRVVERAWLALTAEKLAVQPMMSVAVLANALENGSPELVARVRREGTEEILAEFRRRLSEIGGDHVGFILRFGYAPPPTGRTGRLPANKVADVP
ncbi:MAG: hypothetical protein V1809_13465 [Planctomycetota bacterium]